MGTWDLLEQFLLEHPVEVTLTEAEQAVVAEALENWADARIDEASAWDTLALFEADEPQLTKAVKGLSPQEVDLVRQFQGNAKSKTGNTGEVVALPPKTWLSIKKELESNPEKYDRALGNPVSIGGLVKKIGDSLGQVMGAHAAGQTSRLPSVAPRIPPVQMPQPVPGKSQGGGGSAMGGPGGAGGSGSPFGSRDDAAARRARVAAQDAEMMGGRHAIGRMMKNPKLQVQGHDKGEVNEDLHDGVLTKKTHHAGSISLTQEEWDALLGGGISKVEVVGPSGKKMASIDGGRMAAYAKAGGAKLLQVNDDPDMPHYWVVDIRRLMRK